MPDYMTFYNLLRKEGRVGKDFASEIAEELVTLTAIAADRATAPVSVAQPVATAEELYPTLSREEWSCVTNRVMSERYQHDRVNSDPEPIHDQVACSLVNGRGDKCTCDAYDLPDASSDNARPASNGEEPPYLTLLRPVVAAKNAMCDRGIVLAQFKDMFPRFLAHFDELAARRQTYDRRTVQDSSIYDLLAEIADEEIMARNPGSIVEVGRRLLATWGTATVSVAEPVASVQYIQSLMLKWINAKAGKPAADVWGEIERELKAIAAQPAADNAPQAPSAGSVAEDNFAEYRRGLREAFDSINMTNANRLGRTAEETCAYMVRSLADLVNGGNAQAPSALTDWQHRCAVLVDIYDDGRNNAPEDRCYVDGASTAEMDELRALLQANIGAKHDF